MIRALLLHHSFGPYHAARVEALRRVHAEPVLLAELATTETMREWKKPNGLSVRSAATGALEKLPPAVVAKGVRGLLEETAPDVLIIAGYAHAGMREAARWARANKRRAILISDSHAGDKTRYRVKEAAKRLWVQRHFQAAFTSGAAAAAYVESLGIRPERIWRGYDAVDNDAFARAADEARRDAENTRARLGLPRRFLLFTGRLSEEKNLSLLLRAFAKASVDGLELVLVGGGPGEKKLRAAAEKSGPVRLRGFLQQEDVAQVYGLAEALVLPSTSEPWGLVVNEAMSAGLPILASTACGCVPDLVFPGVNGWTFSPRDEAALAEAIRALATDEGRRARMGKASKEIIAPWSLERWARALSDCIHTVAEGP